MRRLARTSSILAFLIFPFGHQPSAQCPTNTWIGCGMPSTSTAPTFQSEIYGYGCGYGNASGNYDLIVGTLAVHASGWYDGGGTSTLTTEDIYWILGPDPGSPVSLTALLTVNFSGSASPGRSGFCTGAGGSARLSGGGSSKSLDFSFPGCGYFFYSGMAALPLMYRVGEPFHLVAQVDVRAGISGGASVSGSLMFTLPLGYSMTSCQGYSAPPTATRAVSWGRLKTIYR